MPPLPRKPRLSVVTEGKRHFINVPSGFGPSLHSYLKENGVHCGSPEPAFTGIDTVELHKSTRPEPVQKLLDQWA
jgi:hypothetical protein